MIDLLKINGYWHKANLHCHTTLSDGKMTPQQIKDWYRSHGYSIVAYTDHSKYFWHKELKDENFLPIAGVEAAFTCLDPNNPPLKYKLCHMNFWAKDPETAEYIPEEHTYDVGVMNRYIAAMKKRGFLCGVNHPGWSLQSTEEVHGLIGLDTFEVYNHHGQFLDNNGDGQAHWAVFLNSGKRAYAVAVDDCHAGFEEDGDICAADDTCGGWIMISMPELSYKAFVEAMENGRFYASSGPLFEKLAIDEQRDMLIVECSPVSKLIVKGIHTVRSARFITKGDTITHVEIPLAPIREKEPFLRLELMDSQGRRAYSQPYWFD